VKSAFIAVAALCAAVIGVRALAEQGEDVGDDPPPGEVITAESAQLGDQTSERITTSGAIYDETILTKFIPGTGFDPTQGAGSLADVVNYGIGESSIPCVSSDLSAGGQALELRAAVELPDGARIRRI